MPLDPVTEAAAMRESEDALRDMLKVFHNIGLGKEQIAMLLRSLADEVSPRPTIQ